MSKKTRRLHTPAQSACRQLPRARAARLLARGLVPPHSPQRQREQPGRTERGEAGAHLGCRARKPRQAAGCRPPRSSFDARCQRRSFEGDVDVPGPGVVVVPAGRRAHRKAARIAQEEPRGTRRDGVDSLLHKRRGVRIAVADEEHLLQCWAIGCRGLVTRRTAGAGSLGSSSSRNTPLSPIPRSHHR